MDMQYRQLMYELGYVEPAKDKALHKWIRGRFPLMTSRGFPR